MRLAQEIGHYGDGKEQHQPRREPDQARRQRDQGNQLLSERGKSREKSKAARGLAAGAFELVVKIRVFEADEVEARGMLDEPQTQHVGEPVAQQAVGQADGPGKQVVEYGKRQLDK